jgi:hypothetical protein
MLVLAVISVVVFIKNGGHLSLAPLEPTHITSGFSGLAAGFPVAVYPFTDGGRQERQAGRAMTWRHHGGVSDPSKTSDTRMVRQ